MFKMYKNVEPLEYDGERMIPEKTDALTFWEHLYRYKFASRFVKNRVVLDIACGEGYGTSAILQAGAKRVIGVDISEITSRHAHFKYGIPTIVGSADVIPLASRSINTIVSFETIEHIPVPHKFVEESRRVLVEQGKLIISTPDKGQFSQERGKNRFHCSEFDLQEFIDLLSGHFSKIQIYTQLPVKTAWWAPRSLAATSPPWAHWRVTWRLDKFRRKIYPERWGEVSDINRNALVNLIVRKEGIFSKDRLFQAINPFVVRRKVKAYQERPMFYIVVAQL